MKIRFAAGLLLLIACTAWADPKVTRVMRGLDNPRGLAFGPEGALYVVEAGIGGVGPCYTDSLKTTWCYGPTGAVSRLWKGNTERVITGLPSYARQGKGTRGQGANGIAFRGRGNMYVTIGWENDPRQRQPLLGEAGLLFGQLLRVTPDGASKSVADIGDYITAIDPVRPDTDPFHVLAEPSGEYVIDSGANRLLRVAANGDIETIATFPSRVDGRNTDSVPTSVVVGPDGALYVSELSGVPFTKGRANIYRLVPGEQPEVFLTGFEMAIDLAFNSEGDLYVLEHSALVAPPGGEKCVGSACPGKLQKIGLNGCTTDANLCPRTDVLINIDKPTALLMGPHDEMYISVHGVSPAIGEVWRVEP